METQEQAAQQKNHDPMCQESLFSQAYFSQHYEN